MSISERVLLFLVGNKPDCFCDDCIQRNLGLTLRQEVAPVTKALGLTKEFRRGPGECVSCSRPRTKLVIRSGLKSSWNGGTCESSINYRYQGSR